MTDVKKLEDKIINHKDVDSAFLGRAYYNFAGEISAETTEGLIVISSKRPYEEALVNLLEKLKGAVK